MKARILECIYAAVDEVNEAQDDQAAQMEKRPETPISGGESALDSLGLVNFVVAVEENIERSTGVDIMLSDDRALSIEPNPLSSIETLSAYVELLLEERTRVE